MALYVPGSGLSQDTESAGSLILGFPAPRAVRSVCGFSLPVCGVVLQQPKQTETAGPPGEMLVWAEACWGHAQRVVIRG